jgi:hypothetical protein
MIDMMTMIFDRTYQLIKVMNIIFDDERNYGVRTAAGIGAPRGAG